jgi:hypothetical protein
MQLAGAIAKTLLGVALATGGAVGTGLSGGIASPITVPMMLGGSALTCHGVDQTSSAAMSLGTGIWHRTHTSRTLDYLTGSPHNSEVIEQSVFGGLSVGAGARLSAGRILYPRGTEAPRRLEHLSIVQQRALRSLQQRVAKHQKELADYLNNPDAFDHRGLWRNAPTTAKPNRYPLQ